MTENTTSITTVSILLDILGELRKQRAQEDDLWGPDEIADYTKLSKSSVHSTILRAPGFPTAVILPSGGRRWLSKEIKAWLIRRR